MVRALTVRFYKSLKPATDGGRATSARIVERLELRVGVRDLKT